MCILPDIDLIFRFLAHRGPLHSLITAFVITIPFFFVYRKTVVPYVVALLSHSLIGDFFTGGAQLLWPLSTTFYGSLNINVTSTVNACIELILFILSLGVLFKTGDLKRITEPKKHVLILLFPFMAVLGPLLLLFRGSDYAIPSLLIIPSIFWLSLFTYSVISHFYCVPARKIKS